MNLVAEAKQDKGQSLVRDCGAKPSQSRKLFNFWTSKESGKFYFSTSNDDKYVTPQFARLCT